MVSVPIMIILPQRFCTELLFKTFIQCLWKCDKDPKRRKGESLKTLHLIWYTLVHSIPFPWSHKVLSAFWAQHHLSCRGMNPIPGGMNPIPGDSVEDKGYTIDGVPIYYKAAFWAALKYFFKFSRSRYQNCVMHFQFCLKNTSCYVNAIIE